MKNVLVITGSPRKGGNSELLADAFIKGAKGAGHNVVKFEAAFDTSGGCKACGKCWSSGEPCAFPDGFNKMAPDLEKADVVVFASPLYWFGFSGQLKNMIDKFYSYAGPACPRPLKPKQAVLLMCAAAPAPGVFSGAHATYKNMLGYLKWSDGGMFSVNGVHNPGDISKTSYLAEAENLGAKL